jgi:hypothetical protein
MTAILAMKKNGGLRHNIAHVDAMVHPIRIPKESSWLGASVASLEDDNDPCVLVV